MHLGSKLGDLGVMLAANLRILGQLDHLERHFDNLRRHLVPKVGHKTPFRGSECYRTFRKTGDLDPRGGGRGKGYLAIGKCKTGKWKLANGNFELASGKRRRALNARPEAGGYR